MHTIEKIVFILKKITLAMCFITSMNLYAGVKVISLDMKTNGSNGFINVGLEGRSSELPDLKVYGKTIELIVSDATDFLNIDKNIKGAQLRASSLNGKAVVKVTLPYEVKQDAVNLGWNKKNIEIIFPRSKSVVRKETDHPIDPDKNDLKSENKILTRVESKVLKESLDENYLKKLMDEEQSKNSRPVVADTKKDEVKIKQSSISIPEQTKLSSKTTEQNDGFSFTGYALKFSIFLALVLGLFYGIVQLLKKGVFNRGKLGFLNNNQLIQVLSTTYVSPKRSLLVVKAHKQIFLVSNSESGIQLISEMSDTTGLIKEGEKSVTGTNFDLSLNSAEVITTEDTFKLKEDINFSTPIPEEKGIQALTTKEIVKFSDELKKKAKKLRPIEFNKNEANV